MSFFTWGFTIRPCGQEDTEFFAKAMNDYCGLDDWWGVIEHKYDEDEKIIEGTRHIHVGMVYPNKRRKDSVDKWLMRKCKETDAFEGYKALDSEKDYLKVQKRGLNIWYSWDWLLGYAQGEWINNKEPTKEDIERIEKLFPIKGDKSAQPSRTSKPLLADKIAAFYRRDYGEGKVFGDAPKGHHLGLMENYINYLMYTTKEIGLYDKRKMDETAHHVFGLLDPPKIPDLSEYRNIEKGETTKESPPKPPVFVKKWTCMCKEKCIDLCRYPVPLYGMNLLTDRDIMNINNV